MTCVLYWVRFVLVVPKVITKVAEISISHPNPSTYQRMRTMEETFTTHLSPTATFLHPVATRRCFQFPETRLIQYDCGMYVRMCFEEITFLCVLKNLIVLLV